MQRESNCRLISAGLGTLIRGLCFLACDAISLSRTCLHSTTQLSQIYTPGPAISFLTSACDLPQKLHSVIFVGRAIEFIPFYRLNSLPFLRTQGSPCAIAPLHPPAHKLWPLPAT